MRRSISLLMIVGMILVGPGWITAQEKGLRPALIIFRDGFVIKGKVKEQKDFIVDPASGASFQITNANGFLYVDDGARRIMFSPTSSQVQKVFPLDPQDEKGIVKLTRPGYSQVGASLLPGMVFESYSDWSTRWERLAHVSGKPGRFDMTQRITLLTPYFTRVEALRFNWIPCYLTREFGPDQVLRLLNYYFLDSKDMKDAERREKIARFLIQAGWIEHAEREIKKIKDTFPERKDLLEPIQESLKKTRASLLVEEVERAHKVGQHDLAQRLIKQFFQASMNEAVPRRVALQIQDYQNKYETAQAKIKEANLYLQELPRRLLPGTRNIFGDALQSIQAELHLDTVDRLDTFLEYAQQHEREIKQKRQTSQRSEEILALAVSGWVQGNNVAAPEVDVARTLWMARTLILEHHKETLEANRKRLLETSSKSVETLPIDLIARMIPMLPPAEPFALKDFKNPIKVGEALVQLPPEYHHQRPYPVLFVLHAGGEKASEMMGRWSELAEQHGFILAAITWGKGLRPTYQYTAREHDLVLDCLRELRRRFNIDSDRVFLFGREEGGNMALDIGLSHPDQFAGVLTMCASPAYFPTRYWSNAQYLPLYLVEGALNGTNAKANRALLKEWIRAQYAAIYFEYKDRPGELFEGEFASMFDWMSRKRRFLPAKELGRYHTGGGTGEEFKTMRATDNQFYWLSADGISARSLNNPPPAWNNQTLPATLYASIKTGNEITLKKEGVVKDVRIWNQINVRTKGVDRVTIWLGSNMIDFTKPVQLLSNKSSPAQVNVRPSLATLLEHFHQHGDRQRLYFAKIEFKP